MNPREVDVALDRYLLAERPPGRLLLQAHVLARRLTWNWLVNGADFLKRYIRDPQSLRQWPQAKMPGFSATVLPDGDLERLVGYLKHMAGRKAQP